MFAALALALAQSIEWTRVDIDAKFRSEGVAVGDFNHDGKLDIANGEAWYEAPSWKPHALRADGMKEFDPATQYSRCFALWVWNVSRYEWKDLICIDFPGTPCYWLENPAGVESAWKQFEIWGDACNESPRFDYLDGKWPELLIGSEREGTFVRVSLPLHLQAHEPWPFARIGKRQVGAGYEHFDHGLGYGAFFDDGLGDRLHFDEGDDDSDVRWHFGERPAIVTPRGAYLFESATDGLPTWRWSPFVLGADAQTRDDGGQMFVDDFDGDGDIDIAMSSAHGVGVWWYEQVGKRRAPKFVRHTIDDTFSQSHALCYADIDGDGERDLITGKRWYAHGPDGDVDAKAEPVVVWYQVKKGSKSAPKFTRHEIEVARGTGIGTQFQVIDVDGDQRADIVLSNKRGTHLLLQRAPETKK